MIQQLRDIYTIPFSKEKVEELSKYFSETIGFSIKDKGSGGRRYSCSYEEFVNMEYRELVDLKTGFTDYWKTRQQRQREEKGGVN
jgi:hypothetical protein